MLKPVREVVYEMPVIVKYSHREPDPQPFYVQDLAEKGGFWLSLEELKTLHKSLGLVLEKEAIASIPPAP